MSFCRGSVNCHGSDGQMYHFCESSRSGEIFLDQYRGVGVFIPRDKFIRIGLFRSVNRPSVASESWPTPVTRWNFNTSGCDSKLNIILIGLTDDPSGHSVNAMYLIWLDTHNVCNSVPRTCYCDDTINLALGSRGCIALVEHATKGKKHAEKVALRRYLHNIKLKIMLNVYELSYCLVFLFECSIICLGRKWDICTLEAVAR